jgi:hypothetical protein
MSNALEIYLGELREIRASGAAVKETSGYGALANLFNAVGQTLKPKVRCLVQLKNKGAGMPDGGFFTPDQLKNIDDEKPLDGPPPARGVFEVKGTADEIDAIADSDQVRDYLKHYGLVLVTNYRDFLLLKRGGGALREELHIADGLADPRVFVLDPCCGTGAYLVEVLRKIEHTLREEKGEGDNAGGHMKKAAMERIFGFELLPAPFVVAHLQLGILLQNFGLPLDDTKSERAAIYLTNALTGWEPPTEEAKRQPRLPSRNSGRKRRRRMRSSRRSASSSSSAIRHTTASRESRWKRSAT